MSGRKEQGTGKQAQAQLYLWSYEIFKLIS
jgi:hypothetical protein